MTKTLVISDPSPINELTPSIRLSIILVSKFAFVAESDKELTVKKGDILKLLDRPGNGWVLVKFVDRLVSPGLVPSSYVDIAINDSVHPVTLTWLQGSHGGVDGGWNQSNYVDVQVKQLLRSNSPLTINNRAYPVGCSIANCLSFDNRYWYRLDITYSDHSQSYVCRYYQDFYQLHIALVQCREQLQQIYAISDPQDSAALPKLPEPIPSTCLEDPQQLMQLLLKRCNHLHVYMNKLIMNKNYQTCDTLLNWMDLGYHNLGGFAVEAGEQGSGELTNDEINERVFPDSANLFKVEVANASIADRDSKGSRGSDLPQRTKSKNIYNHYQQVMTMDHTKHQLPLLAGSPALPALRLNTAVANGVSNSNSKKRSTQDSYNSTLVSVFSSERVSPDATHPELEFSFTKRR